MSTSLAERLAKVAAKSTATLVHRGRKSGKPYEVTIWFMVDGDTVWLATMNMGRQWTRNVRQNPEVALRMGSETFRGTVAAVTDDTEMAQVVELMKRKYWLSIPYLWLKGRPDGAFRMRVDPAQAV